MVRDKKKNIIKIALITILVLITSLITANKTMAQTYSSLPTTGGVTVVGNRSDFLNSSYVFCADAGMNFGDNQKYMPYTTGDAGSAMGYMLIEYGTKGERDYTYDPVQTAVWLDKGNYGGGSDFKHNDFSKFTPIDVSDMQTEATFAANTAKGGNISISKPSSGELVHENGGAGQWGPFQITYPSFTSGSGETKVIGEVTIKLNGREISGVPSGEDFYLSEVDGIIPGEKNTLKIEYTGYKYTAPYQTYLAPVEITHKIICKECGKTIYTEVGKGFVQGGSYYFLDGEEKKVSQGSHATHWEQQEQTTWKLNAETGEWESETTIVSVQVKCKNYNETGNWYREETSSGGQLYQNLIEYKPTKTEFHEEASIDFWPGRKLVIDLNKTDNAAVANALKGMIFDINVSGDSYIKTAGTSRSNTATITTDSNGKAQATIITYEDRVRVTLTEHDDILYINDSPIIIDYDYNGGSWSPTIVSPTGAKSNLVSIGQAGNWFQYGINIKNRAKIEKLKVVKINTSVPGEVIPGVTFRITLTNAKTEDGMQTLIKTTDANGEIELGILEVIDPNYDITVTFEEVGVPTTDMNFLGLYPDGEAVITLKHGVDGCQVDLNGTITGKDQNVVNASYYRATNILTVEIKNEVTIDLKGKVWLDGQTGLKPVKGPNGLYDANETLMANIKVVARRVSDNAIIQETVTDANGNYILKDLPESINGIIKYYVEFTYDGINYIATTPKVGNDETIDSDAYEIDRAAFNDKFKTIEKDVAIATDGTRTSLEGEYDITTDPTKAVLVTNKEDGIVKDKFAMVATTKPIDYNINTNNIDMGLVKKGVDLAAITDVYQAKISINGKEKIYNYNDIQELQRDEENNPILEPLQIENVRYNLYLYDSDYNYRIADYKLPAARNDGLAVNTMNASSNLLQQRQNDGDLNIEVTYQILLNNQSATDATINNIAYYYDPHYVLAGATPELVTINGKTYNKVILNTNTILTDASNQGITQLVFTVSKDEQGNVYTGTLENWVEIISYSTNEGCVDIDSAPDNIETHTTEDDTDDAAGLTIQLNNLQREIKGFVFEDSKTTNPGSYNTGNGQYDEGENKIDDVIVQLIEIKNVSIGNTTLKLEYIWQETESGSNTVRFVTSDGKSQGEYTVSNEPGSYTFKGFIPGNYIVRFIYGDGTYYDTTSAANLTKYNGQDYKSTVDIYYNKTWYDSSIYQENQSMARDNEARRLEEMGYAKSIVFGNVDQLKIDSKEKLDNTWMSAETSAIWMDISDSAIDGDKVQPMQRGINFGLVERPIAYLVLEKHITSLKIDDITDATTNLENYDNHNKLTVKLDANTGKSVFATATNKEENSRGIWKIEEETDKLGGKGIYITYTFRVTNVGDIEYVGQELSKQLLEGKSYEQIASELKTLSYNANYSTQGLYLGTAYYNGEKTDNDVNSKIPFQIEDYISSNNELKLDTTNSDFAIVNEKQTKNVWDYVTLSTNEKVATDEKTENVNIVQSNDIMRLSANKQIRKELKIYNDSLDSVDGKKEFTYRSYAAQLIYPTTGSIASDAGTLSKGIGLGNLRTVQSYVDDLNSVPIVDITPESDEFIAETVLITMPTGGEDKAENHTTFIVAIAICAVTLIVGVILIKKFAIK